MRTGLRPLLALYRTRVHSWREKAQLRLPPLFNAFFASMLLMHLHRSTAFYRVANSVLLSDWFTISSTDERPPCWTICLLVRLVQISLLFLPTGACRSGSTCTKSAGQRSMMSPALAVLLSEDLLPQIIHQADFPTVRPEDPRARRRTSADISPAALDNARHL